VGGFAEESARVIYLMGRRDSPVFSRSPKNEEPRFARSKTGFLGGNWGEFRGKVSEV
jgi:hypothetical protein